MQINMKDMDLSKAVIIFNNRIINMRNVVMLEYNSNYEAMLVHYSGEVGGSNNYVSKMELTIPCTENEYNDLLKSWSGE